MSNKEKGKGGQPEALEGFDGLGDFGADGSHDHLAHEHNDLEFGDGDEAFPGDDFTMPHSSGKDTHGHGDGHDDAHGADHFGPVDDEHGEHGEHDGDPEHHAASDEDPQEPAEKSLLSKLMLPIGGAIAVMSVGGLGYMQYGDILFGASPAPLPAQQAVGPTPIGPGPRLPVAPAPQAQVQAQPMTGMNARAALPVAQPTSPFPPATQPFPQAQSPMTAPPPSILPPIVAPPAAPSALEGDLVALVSEIRAMNKSFVQVSDRLDDTRKVVVERFDKTDLQMADIGGRVNAVDLKIGGIEQRVAALEASRPAVASHPAAPGAHPAAATPAAKPVAAAPKHVASHGYILRGISESQNAALVETPGGVKRVAIGDTLAGKGVVTGIIREGASWALVTSGGIVRP